MKVKISPIGALSLRSRTARSNIALSFMTICARTPAALAGESKKMRCRAGANFYFRRKRTPSACRGRIRPAHSASVDQWVPPLRVRSISPIALTSLSIRSSVSRKRSSVSRKRLSVSRKRSSVLIWASTRSVHHRELGAGGLQLQPAPAPTWPKTPTCTGCSACWAGGSTAPMWTPNWPARAPKRRRAASTSSARDQAFDLTSLTHHIAEGCTGDILFKGALRDDVAGGLRRHDPRGARRPADQLLPVGPYPVPQRPGQGRQRARPGDPGERCEVLARRDHRHDRRGPGVLPDAAAACRASRPKS